jgi:pSer/pThr/pTyr-binding forkhead associated (FHA) protein
MSDDAPPPLILVVNVPTEDETVILHLTNAADELPQHWQIGRASDCAVRIRDKQVSAHHATIRAEPIVGGNNYDHWGRRRYLWRYKDNSSTNGTFQDGIQIGGRGHPSPWIEIEDNDSIMIGQQTRIRFSFDGNFTDGTGEITVGLVSEPYVTPSVPTDIRSKAEDAGPKDTLWDILYLVLLGPKSTANWLWWLFLAIVGSAVFLTLEWIRSR